MSRKTQLCITAFALTLLFVGGLCGFVAVDLSTNRYLPGSFDPLLRMERVDSSGVAFSVMGETYTLASSGLDGLREELRRYRGFLPDSVTLTAGLTVRGYALVQEYLGANSAEEDDW